MNKINVNELEVCMDYTKGESTLTLAKKYNISYQTVNRIILRNGYKLRSYREMTINATKNGRDSHSDLQREVTSKRWLGKNNPRFQPVGSKRKSHDYVLVKTKYGWIQEHRLIAQEIIGRKLKHWEVVHHINKIKYDNRPENLFLMTSKEHKSFHTVDNIHKKLGIKRLELKSNLNFIK